MQVGDTSWFIRGQKGAIRHQSGDLVIDAYLYNAKKYKPTLFVSILSTNPDNNVDSRQVRDRIEGEKSGIPRRIVVYIIFGVTLFMIIGGVAIKLAYYSWCFRRSERREGVVNEEPRRRRGRPRNRKSKANSEAENNTLRSGIEDDEHNEEDEDEAEAVIREGERPNVNLTLNNGNETTV